MYSFGLFPITKGRTNRIYRDQPSVTFIPSIMALQLFKKWSGKTLVYILVSAIVILAVISVVRSVAKPHKVDKVDELDIDTDKKLQRGWYLNF